MVPGGNIGGATWSDEHHRSKKLNGGTSGGVRGSSQKIEKFEEARMVAGDVEDVEETLKRMVANEVESPLAEERYDVEMEEEDNDTLQINLSVKDLSLKIVLFIRFVQRNSPCPDS